MRCSHCSIKGRVADWLSCLAFHRDILPASTFIVNSMSAAILLIVCQTMHCSFRTSSSCCVFQPVFLFFSPFLHYVLWFSTLFSMSTIRSNFIRIVRCAVPSRLYHIFTACCYRAKHYGTNVNPLTTYCGSHIWRTAILFPRGFR